MDLFPKVSSANGKASKDDYGVVCRRWNWREAERTKLTESTKNAIIVMDALAPVDRVAVERATHELADLIKKYCGGELEIKIIDQLES